VSDAIQAALQLQHEAAAEGFDWSDEEGLWSKLAEEIGELRAAATPGERFEELGDLLFMVVNLARHLHADPDAALRQANAKFERRWQYILDHRNSLPAGGRERLDAMEQLWTEAKRREKAAHS
jgi:uncharacterized protein YabN with tetrapyrrole methylase and pyrophosphatase domain